MATEEHPPSPDSPPVTALEQRVLIIDDDRDEGVMIGRLLRPLQVVFAQSAAGALGRIRAGGRFGAVVCDLHMPGIDGMQFWEAVRAEVPSLARRILYVTGSGDSAQLRAFLDRTGCRCVHKPFDRETLRSAVDELMQMPPA